jgi:hypothetical protein
MSNTNVSLVFIILMGVLCSSAVAETKPDEYAEQLYLIGQANPALKGVDKLYLIVGPNDGRASTDGLVWKQLADKIEYKLKRGGIEIVDGNSPEGKAVDLDIPELRINIDMLTFNNSRLYVFRVQTSLAVRAYLEKHNLFFKADVWKVGPEMQVVAMQAMPSRVTKETLRQIDAFIHSHMEANQRTGRGRDVNDVKALSLPVQNTSAPAAEPATVQDGYVASKNGKVFHKPDCRAVKRIAVENLINYNSMNEAVKDGRRACKLCEP